VERSITADEVVSTLERLLQSRGASTYIRSDNGLQFVARAVKGRLEICGVGTLYVDPDFLPDSTPTRRRLSAVSQTSC
jgi:putative transposase